MRLSWLRRSATVFLRRIICKGGPPPDRFRRTLAVTRLTLRAVSGLQLTVDDLGSDLRLAMTAVRAPPPQSFPRARRRYR